MGLWSLIVQFTKATGVFAIAGKSANFVKGIPHLSRGRRSNLEPKDM